MSIYFWYSAGITKASGEIEEKQGACSLVGSISSRSGSSVASSSQRGVGKGTQAHKMAGNQA